MYGMADAFLLQTILIFFLMPETAYYQADVLHIDTSSHDDPPETAKELKTEYAESVTPGGCQQNHEKLLVNIIIIVAGFLRLAVSYCWDY